VSFLAPLFLAGAAAIALPFVFHLIRRSSREKIVFSSLMFLDPSPPKITKRSRLEHILLLLLRCAVLCLVAFAFARPFLEKPMAAAATNDQTARVAILIDTSASMRRENLWAEAKDRALKAVRALNPSDIFALYAFDQQLRTVLSFAETAKVLPNDRVPTSESRLNGISPGWSGTHLGSTMIQATEHLLEELNRDSKEQGNAVLRLIVISDVQSGAKLDGLQGFEWPKQLEVQFETVKTGESSNAGLQVLDETRNAFAATTNTAVRLRVNNAARSKSEQFEVQWRRGGIEPLGEKASVYVPAGQSRILTAPSKPEGATALMLTGDKVDFDNQAYSAQPKQSEILVTYFGSEPAGDPQQMRYYLHRAFEQTNLATRVLAFSNTVPAEAQQSALLVLGAAPGSEVTELAKSVLKAGRTVLLPLRDPSAANVISSLTGLLAPSQEIRPDNFGLFGRINFQHPLFTPFSDARFSDFTKIHFWKFRGLDLANLTNASVIAAFDTGQPLLTEIPVENGRLLVLASTWMPADSQLALSSKFIPLLFGILEQSASLRSGTHQYLVADAVPLPPKTKEVALPNGERKSVQEGITRFTDTSLPGLYTAGDFQFAVNIDPGESRITPLTFEELQSLGIPLSRITDAATQKKIDERRRHLLATETESQQKLWRNFLLAALAVVVIESWLAGRISRQPSSVATA
jgi:hypothetical protein